MLLLTRFLVFLLPILTIVLLEILYFYHASASVVIVLGIILFLLIVLTIRLLNHKKYNSDLVYFTLTYYLFVLCGILFITLLEAQPLIHIAIVVVAVICGLLLESIFRLSFLSAYFSRDLVISLINNINALTLYCFVSFLYALNLLFNIDLAWLTVALLVATSIFANTIFSFLNIQILRRCIYILCVAIINIELFWALSFLPIIFYINSFIIVLVYYIFVSLIVLREKTLLTQLVVRKYIIFAILSLLIVLGTAKWI